MINPLEYTTISWIEYIEKLAKEIMNITEAQEQAVNNWEETYKPIENQYGDRGWNGLIFETYGKDNDMVLLCKPNHIWTWVDTDEGTAIMSGYHIVNRIGYFITVKPWEEDITIEVNSNGDEE